MAPDEKQSTGAEAYHLRRALTWSWGRIANHLAYRPGAENYRRRHALMMLAKDYAVRKRLPWPVGR